MPDPARSTPEKVTMPIEILRNLFSNYSREDIEGNQGDWYKLYDAIEDVLFFSSSKTSGPEALQKLMRMCFNGGRWEGDGSFDEWWKEEGGDLFDEFVTDTDG